MRIVTDNADSGAVKITTCAGSNGLPSSVMTVPETRAMRAVVKRKSMPSRSSPTARRIGVASLRRAVPG